MIPPPLPPSFDFMCPMCMDEVDETSFWAWKHFSFFIRNLLLFQYQSYFCDNQIIVLIESFINKNKKMAKFLITPIKLKHNLSAISGLIVKNFSGKVSSEKLKTVRQAGLERNLRKYFFKIHHPFRLRN